MSGRPQNQLALVSVIAGAISWLAIPFIGAVVAVVCGHMARKQIRETQEEGDQMAVIGLALGYAHLAMFCLVCGAIVAVYGFGFLAYFGMAMSQ